MNRHADLRCRSRPGHLARLFLVLAGGSLIFCRANAQQARQQPFEERQTPRQAFLEFAHCVRSRNVSCIANLASDHGVYLGVDAQLVSKEVFKRQLTSGRTLRCLFWGVSCSNTVSERCSVLSVLNGSTVSIEYTKPALYKDHWQVEITVRDPSRFCAQDLPIVWNLEKGFWRIAAVSYI